MEYIDGLLIMEDGDDDDNGVNNFEESETTPTGSGCSKPPLWEPAPEWSQCRHC